MNIYVGNLPYSAGKKELEEMFAQYGDVGSARIIFDRRTRRSRGYGFVEMPDEQQGSSAVEALNGSEFGGRPLRVNEAHGQSEGHSRRPAGTTGAGQAYRNTTTRTPRPGSHAPRAKEGERAGGFLGFLRNMFR